jgi:hypothetical protein
LTDQHDLRVSDEQREAAAREIREHFAAGRLNEDELSGRLHAVYRARTEGELRALRADLPGLPVTAQQQRAELAERRTKRLLQHTGGALVPFVICTVVWVASGASSPFWPVWVLLVAVIPLLRNGWRLYGPAPELDRAEQELAYRARHRQARALEREARHRHRRL